MNYRITSVAVGLVLLVGVVGAADDPAVFQIGMVDSLVKDIPPGKRKVLEADFPELVKDFTGLTSQLHQGGDPLAAGKKLAAGEWHLAVFHGVEFAWAQAKEPRLRPLTVAVGRERAIHAVLVVNKEATFTGFADLKGKDIQLLLGRAHCQLYLDKNTAGKADAFFGKVLLSNSAEEALDNVLRGKVQAALVDNSALAIYEDINPGRYQRLKTIAKSERFPGTVIACCDGVLSKAALTKFQEGLLKAHQTEKGREALANFRVAMWEVPAADYAAQMAEIRKAYPGK